MSKLLKAVEKAKRNRRIQEDNCIEKGHSHIDPALVEEFEDSDDSSDVGKDIIKNYYS